jgi:hypothetical protein
MTPFEELLIKEEGKPTMSGILSMFCNQKTDENVRNTMKI